MRLHGRNGQRFPSDVWSRLSNYSLAWRSVQDGDSGDGLSLKLIFQQRSIQNLEARPLTLRWGDSAAMQQWCVAFQGHRVGQKPAPTRAGARRSASSEVVAGPAEGSPGEEPAADPNEATQPSLATPDGPPPSGLCFKKKQNVGVMWPERWLQIEPTVQPPPGVAQLGMYVYGKEGDTEPRGSSIVDLRGCRVETGMERWLTGPDMFRLSVHGDRVVDKSAHFCFKEEHVRDAFFAACYNLAAGRDWNVTAQMAAARAAATERAEQQRQQEEFDQRVAEESAQRVEAERGARAKAEAEAAAAKVEAAAAAAAAEAERERAEEEKKQAAEKQQEIIRRQAMRAQEAAAATPKVAATPLPEVHEGTAVSVFSKKNELWVDGKVKSILVRAIPQTTSRRFASSRRRCAGGRLRRGHVQSWREQSDKEAPPEGQGQPEDCGQGAEAQPFHRRGARWCCLSIPSAGSGARSGSGCSASARVGAGA